MLGLAVLERGRSIIFRRVAPSLTAIIERSKAILGADAGTAYNETKRRWALAGGRSVRFASMQHEKNKFDYQGQAHDFYGFDEITEFSESMFRFDIGWNRTADPSRRRRVVATGNPPCTAEGEWVLRYWDPWLDPSHPNPAAPRELRWFTTLGGADVELPDGGPVEVRGEAVRPRSRTFVPAHVQDNPYLVATGYTARLQALPEPLRSRLLYGDFTAGRDDDTYQVIPGEWVRLAQERWEGSPPPGLPMDAMGIDVARGGADCTIRAMRHGNWVAELKKYPGTATPDGPAVAALALANRRDGALMNIDVVGAGSSVYDHLRAVSDRAVPINGAEHSDGADRSGELRFVNLRAEMWWKLREALDPAGVMDIALPPDRGLAADLCAPTWRLTYRGIQVEPKEEIIKRLGRSPDAGDAVVYAFALKTAPGMCLYEWLKREAGGGRALPARD